MMNLAWLVPLFPFTGFILAGLFSKRLPVRFTGWIASATVLIPFLISSAIFFNLLKSAPAKNIVLFDWITTGKATFAVEFLIDQLTVLMLLVITGVGFLIHVYSIGYMQGDSGYNRFFSYMNLFVFFMTILVMGGSFIIMFIGWEGVGLCSYLLIGFWYKNQEYNDAAKKAFIMNRIGDLGFLLGIFLIYKTFGSLSYSAVFSKAAGMVSGTTVITIITLLLFIGATGKSAQIPLLTWLPDAMAGPTPVSALIHAATMVTAGIYMVARSNIIYSLSPISMAVIAYTGLATSLLAALIALYQNDIKKVLAYSTISQLGLMFLGLGSGVFAGAIFHLMTHAFFKALLFLAAGSIIHALAGEQDVRRMGGLLKKIPVTFMVFTVATLAISGIPPFAGFFSKDEILAGVYASSPVLWVMGVAVSVLTAFYMFRILFLSFSGIYRGKIKEIAKVHESPKVMLIPLILLAFLSVAGGFVGLPESWGVNHIDKFLSPVFSGSEKILNQTGHNLHGFNYILMAITVSLFLASAYVAWRFFEKKGDIPPSDEVLRKGFAGIAYNKFYIDDLYRTLFVNPVLKMSSFFHDFIDMRIIDRFIEWVGSAVMWSGGKIRLLQTGNVGFYLFAMVICILLVLAISVFGKLF